MPLSLRDLILGRRRRTLAAGETPQPDGSGLSRAVLDATDMADVADEGQAAATNPSTAPVDGDERLMRGPGAVAGQGRRVVLARVRSMTVPGALVAEARRQAVLDRLFIVLDPNEVVITAKGQVARLVMANQSLMLAEFGPDGAPDVSFDFRDGVETLHAALEFMRALSAFCALPSDLVIAEQPVTGVFAGSGGLPVGALSFDEDELASAVTDLLPPVPQAGTAGRDTALPDHVEPAEAVAPTFMQAEAPGPDPVDAPAAPSRLEPLILSQPDPAPAAPPDAVPDPAPPRLAALAFLSGCRAVAEDVQVQTPVADAEGAALRATDLLADLPGAAALEVWRQSVAPAVGGRLVAVLIPADRAEQMVALALDDRDAVLFRFGKQALGTVSGQAVAALAQGQGA